MSLKTLTSATIISTLLTLTGCIGGTDAVVETKTVTVEKIVKVEVPAPLPVPILILSFSAPNPVRVIIPGQNNALLGIMTVSGNKDQCYRLTGFVIGNSYLAKSLKTVGFLEIETPGTPRSYIPEMTPEEHGTYTELRLPSYYDMPICLAGGHTYEVRADIKPDTPTNTPLTIRGGEVMNYDAGEYLTGQGEVTTMVTAIDGYSLPVVSSTAPYYLQTGSGVQTSRDVVITCPSRNVVPCDYVSMNLRSSDMVSATLTTNGVTVAHDIYCSYGTNAVYCSAMTIQRIWPGSSVTLTLTSTAIDAVNTLSIYRLDAILGDTQVTPRIVGNCGTVLPVEGCKG